MIVGLLKIFLRAKILFSSCITGRAVSVTVASICASLLKEGTGQVFFVFCFLQVESYTVKILALHLTKTEQVV